MVREFLAELEFEAPATRGILSAVPPERYNWRPHPKSLTAGALAKHIAVIPMALFEVVNQDSFDVSMPGPTFESCSSREELLELFEQSLTAARRGLEGVSEERIAASWHLKSGAHTIASIPRGTAFRTLMFSHLYHHRGQLSVYLRLLDVPVPSVYGPTADVNPLAG